MDSKIFRPRAETGNSGMRTAPRMGKRDLQIEKMDPQIGESDLQIGETDPQIGKSDLQMGETDLRVGGQDRWRQVAGGRLSREIRA